MTTVYINDFINRLGKKNVVDGIIKGAALYDYKTKFVTHQKLLATEIKSSDILVIWNRHLDQDKMAQLFESKGAKVVLIENPYLDIQDENEWVSVGLGYHNNQNYAIPCQDSGQRFDSFNIDIKPWKNNSDGHILITTQAKRTNGEGLGFAEYKQPSGWDIKTIEQISQSTNRKILFRTHPKSKVKETPDIMVKGSILNVSLGSKTSLQTDLLGAYCTVVYTSNSATESLINGIPVFYTGPHLFMKDCCLAGLNLDNRIFSIDRKKHLDRMAWNQYNVKELETGLLFEILKGL